MIGTEIGWPLALVLGLSLVLGAGAAQGQSDDATPATTSNQKARPARDTAEGGDPESIPEDEAVPGAVPGQAALPEDDESMVPEAIREAIENQDSVHATMDRFVPTEKLSEDRAVSFPNDI